MTRTPTDVVRDLLAGVPALVNNPAGAAPEQVERLAQLYAERTDVRHPMSLTSVPPLHSRDELRRHFAEGPGSSTSIDAMQTADVRIHETTDPEVVIAEFTYLIRCGEQVTEVPCIFVVRVRDGVIVESRDYASSVHFARATGSARALFTHLLETSG